MQLTKLLSPWLNIPAEFERDIGGMSLDSRTIAENEMFIALVGTQLDGRHFIPQALQRNINVILAEGEAISIHWHTDKKIPHITLPHLNQLYGFIAARFYGEPAKQLQIIGVTGTNGKTSCTHFIADILTRIGKPCAVIGTVGNGALDNLQKTANTTPDAISIQKLLAEMRDQGFQSVAMEIASHALDQYRVNGVQFAATVFTNLTQDHLDYHHTMENYAEAKLKLFTEFASPVVVLNIDDEQGKLWIKEALKQNEDSGFNGNKKQIQRNIFAYSINKDNAISLHFPCIIARHAKFTRAGMTAQLDSPWGQGEMHAPLLGQFNLHNLLAVVATLCGLGENFSSVLEKIHTLKSVKGRMQLLTAEKKPTVIIDYAHTPDALEKALETLAAYQPKQLWCVFGCGGDRDKMKRPMMGEIAARYADQIIITDDNCRTEDPAIITTEISAGIPAKLHYKIEHNRARAIEYALKHANADDMILIAGKGHEDYQEINGQRHYFSDIDEVKRGLGIKD